MQTFNGPRHRSSTSARMGPHDIGVQSFAIERLGSRLMLEVQSLPFAFKAECMARIRDSVVYVRLLDKSGVEHRNQESAS